MGVYIQKAMNRGSEWYRWEPHIHAPGTVLSDQYPKDRGWELYLEKLEKVVPPLRAIGVTDYCITRSYERVREEKEKGRLTECDLLFPNIELRLNTGTVKGNFVNIHLLVSPEHPDHLAELNRFLGRLWFQAFDDKFSCTPADLIRLGRKADPSKINEDAALQHGVSQFKISLENLIQTYRDIEWAHDNIIIAVAGTADGTSGVREAADTTLREEIEKAAHVIFAGSPKQREFWLGNGEANACDLRRRYGGQKPCLWGCDAHDLSRVGIPAEGRLCWIKGEPRFDAVRQACIDPERAYVGQSPPMVASASQIIDEVVIEQASWLETPILKLNQGLIAIIGARGSGKTALVDIIAAGCDSYFESEERPSFLARAREHLSGSRVTLRWLSGGDHQKPRSLDSPVSRSPDSYPRARYLSQQFVEELCSVEGMPALIKEIERVIFEAHPSLERDGAVDFEELLELRAARYRNERIREEEALANLSDQIGIELEKSRQVPSLKAQIAEKKKLIARYQGDRKNLLPKKESKTAERLQEITVAAEKVRGYIRFFTTRQASLVGLRNEVQDLRQNRAPEALRSMKDRYQNIGLEVADWESFMLTYSGDVNNILAAKDRETEKSVKSWKGTTPMSAIDDSGAFLSEKAEFNMTPLAILEAEIGRLEKIVAADRETARKLSAVSKRIAEETLALDKLKERLADCEGAHDRAKSLTADREKGYIRVFDAIFGQEQVLNELYAPLMNHLKATGGTLSKLSFTVRRVVDVAKWAKRGEDLFDLRGGPFKGIGSLANEANSMLGEAWRTGDSAKVSTAMTGFKDKHQEALLDKAPYPRSDSSSYRPWSRRFAQWLYSTDHISIEYGIKYDGIDIRKLSPGTRGIVLVLLYLALDDGDDRPLIIDQPEENLDPKSIYDELVPLFREAKHKRQVIMVTHNANLVVNTDADQIIVANAHPRTTGGLPLIEYQSGGLDVICRMV